MKALLHALAFIAIVALFSFLLVGCKTTEPQRVDVTSHAHAVVGDAAAATAEASKASQRSSVHIKAFRDDASLIDFKASRALEILNNPMSHP